MCSISLWAGGAEAKESQVAGTDIGFVSLPGQRHHCIPQGGDKERAKKGSLKHKSSWKFSLLHALTSCCLLACLLSTLKETRLGKKKKQMENLLLLWLLAFFRHKKLNPAATRPSVLLVVFPCTFIVFLPRF